MLQSMCRGDICLNQEKEKGPGTSSIEKFNIDIFVRIKFDI